MFIEMNKIRQLANTLIYQDILQQIWKKIHQTDAFYRKEREHFQIQDFDLVRKGLNGKR